MDAASRVAVSSAVYTQCGCAAAWRRADRRDGSPVQYWLHRVQIHLEPGDLTPGVGEELADFMGNVPLSMLHERGGARAVRYVNTNEADGSISVAIEPAVIATVATIEIPVESVAIETAAAARRSREGGHCSRWDRASSPRHHRNRQHVSALLIYSPTKVSGSR